MAGVLGRRMVRRLANRAEVGVDVRYRGDKGRLEHLLKLFLACRAIPEDALEVRIKRPEIKHGFDHVAHNHTPHTLRSFRKIGRSGCWATGERQQQC